MTIRLHPHTWFRLWGQSPMHKLAASRNWAGEGLSNDNISNQKL
jgi:hypothetical protein